MGPETLTWKDWEPGKILAINRVVWAKEEIDAIFGVLGRDWLAAGYYVNAFQEALAQFCGGGRFLLTNSGSSALDIAVKTLLASGALKKGDHVLHPALTFNTSATPIVNNGLVPVFADVAPATYNLDPELALQAMKYDPKIKLLILPHLIGNMTNLDVVIRAARERDILTIGDSCDTLGSLWRGKEVGCYTDFTAYSFYASHHITTFGVGGALRVNGPDIDYELAKSLIHWGHDYAARTGDLKKDFDVRYNCRTLGGDSQMTEVQAAFGLAQLAKLPELNQRRDAVWKTINAFLKGYSQYLVLPHSYYGAEPSWFGYAIQVRPDASFTRKQLVDSLVESQIEIRPIFAGNIVEHEAWSDTGYNLANVPNNAISASERGFFIPSWPMNNQAVEFLLDTLDTSLRRLTK